MKQAGTRGLYAAILLIVLIIFSGNTMAGPAAPWDEQGPAATYIKEFIAGDEIIKLTAGVDGAVDFDWAQAMGAEYLRKMQADITEDNAGNGDPDLDPDDGGWDWVTTDFSHSSNASPQNLYGVTALGLYYAYLSSPDGAHFTAMKDAADFIVAAEPPNPPRSATDMKFLLLFNDLYSDVVEPTTVYADAAKAKYDDRIVAYGSATLLAQSIRDIRGIYQNYPNGIIAWDVGFFVVLAQMLYDRYGGTYDQDADDMAEVLWQDSFNDNPGLFDIVDDAGWDPTYVNRNYWWYTIGVTGLIDAFSASGIHTDEIPGLVDLLLASQYADGGISGSYGANAGDVDWQSTAYAMMSLGFLDQAAYQCQINKMGEFLVLTQHSSGGWVYSSGEHLPEVGGECTAGLHFANNIVLSGTVSADCPEAGTGLYGVPVDVYDVNAKELVGSVVTNEEGDYELPGLPCGTYWVSIAPPLGYFADVDTKEIELSGSENEVNFELTCGEGDCQARPRGYWAHQLSRAISGKPDEYTAVDFREFAGLIDAHFNNNEVNPVDHYTVLPGEDSLDVMEALLAMGDRDESQPFPVRIAKAQLLSLMLNVVSGNVHQMAVATADGRTYSQVITYCDLLIDDLIIPPPDLAAGYSSDNTEWYPYVLAGYLLHMANVCDEISAELIPADIAVIAYRLGHDAPLPNGFTLFQNYPNPFNPTTEIWFGLSQPSHVRLEVYNIAGQNVATLVNRQMEAGFHTVTFDGSKVASGMYLYRLTAGGFVESKKMLLVK